MIHLAAATRQPDRFKRLIRERNIVSIPNGDVVVVAEAPPHQRYGRRPVALVRKAMLGDADDGEVFH